MSDSKLRELERRAHETGSNDDVSALLRERVRAGRLPLLRLQMAARLGYPPATIALDDTEAPSLEEGLNELGKEAQVRFGRALLRSGLEVWDETSMDRGPHEALAIADLWLTNPERRDEARSRAKSFTGREQYKAGAAPGRQGGSGWVLRVAIGVMLVVWSTKRTAARHMLAATKLTAGVGQEDPDAGVAAGQRALEAVQVELVAWLLGYGEPATTPPEGSP